MAMLVMGAYNDPESADQAIYELEHFGYTLQDISVITRRDRYEDSGYGRAESLAKGAGAGATTGAAIGGLAGLIAGVGVMPVLAGFFIAGPVGSAIGLTGAAAATISGAATGALAGGLIGGLIRLGLSRDTAQSYDKIVNEGGIVLGVMENSLNNQAQEILAKYGAVEVSVLELGDTISTRAEASKEALDDAYIARRQEPVFGETRDNEPLEYDDNLSR